MGIQTNERAVREENPALGASVHVFEHAKERLDKTWSGAKAGFGDLKGSLALFHPNVWGTVGAVFTGLGWVVQKVGNSLQASYPFGISIAGQLAFGESNPFKAPAKTVQKQGPQGGEQPGQAKH
jgi:hypothetical protein